MKKSIILLLALTLMSCSKPSVEEYIKNARDYVEKGDFRAAVVEYKNALMQQPRNSDLRIELANAHLELGSFDAAEKEFEKAIERGAEQSDVVGPLAKAIYYQDDYVRLLNRLEFNEDEEFVLDSQASLFKYLASVKTTQGRDTNAPIPHEQLSAEHLLIARSYEALSNGNPQAALNISEQYQKTDTESFEKLLIKAAANSMLGQNEQAVDAYLSARSIYDNYIPLQFFLAERFIDVGRIEEAEDLINALYELNPSSGYVNYLRSITLLSREKYQESWETATLAIQNGANLPKAHFVAGVSAYRTGRLESAYRSLKSASGYLPVGHVGQKLLAQVRLELGYVDELVDNIEQIDVDEQISAEIYALAALRNFESSNNDKADEYIEKSISLSPQNPITLLRKGLIQFERGNDEASATLDRALSLDNTLQEGWVTKAKAELDSNGIEAAVAVAEEWQETNLSKGLLLEGLMYLLHGDERKAVLLFEQTVKTDASNDSARRFLMTALARQNRHKEAIEIATELMESQPNDLYLTMDVANLAIASDVDPVPILDKQIAQFPTAAAPVAAKAYIHIKDKKPQDAIDLIKQAQAPAHHSTYMAMGEALIDLNRFDDAIQNFIDWTQAFPSDPRAWTRLIILNQYLKRDGSALEAARKASVQFPNNESFLLLQAHLLVNLGEPEKAEIILKRLEQNKNNLDGFQHVSGMLAYNKGSFAEAQARLAENYSNAPSFKSARLLAFAEGQLGNAEQGLALMNKEVEELQSPYVERHLIAEYALDYGFMDEVFAQYEAILKASPDDFATLNNYANALMKNGDLDGAKRYAEQALELQPQSPYAIGTVGAVELKMGNVELAETYLELAIGKLPNIAELQLHYVELLLKKDRRQQAQNILSQIRPKSTYERNTYKALEDALR